MSETADGRQRGQEKDGKPRKTRRRRPLRNGPPNPAARDPRGSSDEAVRDAARKILVLIDARPDTTGVALAKSEGSSGRGRRSGRRRLWTSPKSQGVANSVLEMGGRGVWREYLDRVDELKDGMRRDPLTALGCASETVHERVLEACRILYLRFGLEVKVAAVSGQRFVRVVNAALGRLDTAEDAADFADAWLQLTIYNDARLAAWAAIYRSLDRGDDDLRTARAACEAIVHVLRSRPLAVGIIALKPDFVLPGPETDVVAELRAAASDVLAAWVRANLRLRDWPGGRSNRLRKALEDMASEGETAEDVLRRELPPTALADFAELLKEAEAEPELPRKNRRTYNRNSVRNRAARTLTKMGSSEVQAQGKLTRIGDREAEAEQALTAYEQAAAADTESLLLNELVAAAGLSPQQEKIVELRRAGKKHSEIAAELATSEGNVRSQFSEAKSRMRKARGRLREAGSTLP